MSDLRNTIAHILEHEHHLADANEATTQQYVILPILRALGWNDTNLASMEVLPEYTVENGNVDYALKAEQDPKLFIECKKWGEPLEKHKDQIVNYALKVGAAIIVGLTNGKMWHLYFSWVEGRPVSERIFCRIDIENREDAVSDLEKYLLKTNVISGEAELNAEIALEEKEKPDTSKLSSIPKQPVAPSEGSGGWTVTRVRDLVPLEYREYQESKHTCKEFYRRVADTLNLVEEKGWKLYPKFSKNYCSLFSEDRQDHKGRRVFGLRLNGFNPFRFYVIITEEEGEKLSNQYGCKMVSYTKTQAHYIVRRDVKELLPVFEFAYNKNRRK